jgi:hypothetical protein
MILFVRCRDTFYNRLPEPEKLEDYVLSDGFLEPIEMTLNTELNIPNSPPLRVKECTPNSIPYLYGHTACKGSYDPLTNEILLVYGIWCRKTLIHEILHSASHFAYGRFTQIGKVQLLNEGITEFFTGWVLYECYEKCYNVWINSGYSNICNQCEYLNCYSCKFCGLSYEKELKVISILLENIDINDLVELYIWKPNSNWKQIYDNFLRKYGIRDVLFKGSRIQYGNFTERFLDAIIDAFGLDEEDVEDKLDSDVKDVLDYSKL